MNLGFPIASAGSRVSARALRAVDRDEPEADVDRWWLLGPPQLNPSERVIVLDIEPDEDGSASVALTTNLEEADAPARVYVRYSRGTLPPAPGLEVPGCWGLRGSLRGLDLG